MSIFGPPVPHGRVSEECRISPDELQVNSITLEDFTEDDALPENGGVFSVLGKCYNHRGLLMTLSTPANQRVNNDTSDRGWDPARMYDRAVYNNHTFDGVAIPVAVRQEIFASANVVDPAAPVPEDETQDYYLNAYAEGEHVPQKPADYIEDEDEDEEFSDVEDEEEYDSAEELVEDRDPNSFFVSVLEGREDAARTRLLNVIASAHPRVEGDTIWHEIGCTLVRCVMDDNAEGINCLIRILRFITEVMQHTTPGQLARAHFPGEEEEFQHYFFTTPMSYFITDILDEYDWKGYQPHEKRDWIERHGYDIDDLEVELGGGYQLNVPWLNIIDLAVVIGSPPEVLALVYQYANNVPPVEDLIVNRSAQRLFWLLNDVAGVVPERALPCLRAVLANTVDPVDRRWLSVQYWYNRALLENEAIAAEVLTFHPPTNEDLLLALRANSINDQQFDWIFDYWADRRQTRQDIRQLQDILNAALTERSIAPDINWQTAASFIGTERSVEFTYFMKINKLRMYLTARV